MSLACDQRKLGRDFPFSQALYECWCKPLEKTLRFITAWPHNFIVFEECESYLQVTGKCYE